MPIYESISDDTSQLDFNYFVNQYTKRVGQTFDKVLSHSYLTDERLVSAMKYVMSSEGKRIRPLLTYAACEAVGGVLDDADAAACAVECVHAYSLVHDDLPSMDNDDLRRGIPTCHKAFDEATAILTGDALQTLAFEMLSDFKMNVNITAQQQLDQLHCLALASGYSGMVGGQSIDLQFVNQRITKEQLYQMHQLKTGSLITASVLMGAMCMPLQKNDKQKLTIYGNAIGLAFQIQDDILDATSQTSILGKKNGVDQLLNKPTYVSILGLDTAKIYIQQLYEEACEVLVSFGTKADWLLQLANFIIQRVR